MSRKASSSAMTNRTIAQQTQSHSTASLFKFNQLTCGILAASALLFAAPGWAASPAVITNQAGATAAGAGDTITLTEAGDEQVINNAATDEITLEKKITGAGKVTKKNDGNVTLNITGSDYSGETLIQNGVLKAGKDNVLSENSSINLSKERVMEEDKFGILDLSNTMQTIKGLEGLAGSKLMLGDNGTLNINSDSDQMFGGLIVGGADSNLNKKGNGILELSAKSNNYEGSITIEAGELKTSTNNDLIASSKALKLSAAAAKFNLNDTNQTVGKLTGMGTVELGTGNLTISYASPGEAAAGLAPAPADITFSGTLTGTGKLIKNGTGTFIFSGTNPDMNGFTGSSEINAGTLRLTKNLNSAISLNKAGTGDNTAILEFANTEDLTYAKAINDLGDGATSSAKLIKTGDKKLTLTAASNFSGETIIKNGTLSFAKAAALTNSKSITLQSTEGASATKGTLELTGGGAFALKNLSSMKTTVLDLGTTALTLNYDTDTPLTIAGEIKSTTGNLIKAGSGTLVFSGTNNLGTDSTITVNAGTLQLVKNLDRNISINKAGAILEFNNTDEPITYNKVLADTGDGANSTAQLIKSGTGKLTLSGAAPNTFSGETIINDGILAFGATPALTNSKSITLKAVPGETMEAAAKSKGTLQLTGADAIALKNLTSQKGSSLDLGSAKLTLNYDAAGPTFNIQGDIKGLEASTLTINAADKTVIFSGENPADSAMPGKGQFKGTTTVNVGTLQLITDLNSDITLKKEFTDTTKFATLEFANTEDLMYSKAIKDAAGADPSNAQLKVKTAAGKTLTLSGVNTFSGATMIESGTLQLNSALPSKSISIASGAKLLSNITGTLTTTISGDGGLQIATGKTLTLNKGSAATNYKGVTTIEAGATLKAGGAEAFSADSEVNIAAAGSEGTVGKLDITAAAQTISALTGGGEVILGANVLTTKFNKSGDAPDTGKTFSGKITGNGGLTKDGSGTLILTGTTNDYVGATTITDGILQAGAENVFSNASAFSVAANKELNLNNFSQEIRSLTGAGNVKLGTATLTVTSGNFGGMISGAGGLTKKGGTTDELTLATAGNDYQGTTTITGGTLKAGANGAFSAHSNVSIGNAGTLDLNATTAQTIGALSGSGKVLLGAAGVLTTTVLAPVAAGEGPAPEDPGVIYSGIISSSGEGTVAGLTKAGDGKLILNGVNTYKGATTISEGTLKLGVANAIAASSGVNIAANGILDLGGFDQSIKALEGAGGEVKLGDKTLTTEIAMDAEKTFSGIITSTTGGGLTKEGKGTLILGATGNNYNGLTTIANGTLKAGIANAFSANSNVIIGAAGTLDLANNNQKIAALSSSAGAEGGTVQLGTATLITSFNKPTEGADTPVTFKGVIAGTGTTGGLTKEGTGTLILTKAATYAGATTVSGGTLQLDAIPTMTSGITVGTGATLAFNFTGNTNFDASKIAGPSGTFKKTGAGELTLNGTASEFKGTTLVEAGTLKFGIANALAGSVLGVSGKMADAAEGTPTPTVNFSGFDQTFAGLQGDGQVIMGVNNITLNTSAATPFTFNGTITGTGTVTKAGEGTQIFNGTGNNTGNVTVNTGTLLIGGASTNSNASFTSTGITVANTGTLGGYGTISAPVIVEQGGILSPGTDTAVGTLTVNNQNLTFKKGSVLNYTVTDSTAANNADLVKVTGTGKVTIEEGSVLNIMTVPGAVRFTGNNSYTVIDSASPIDKSGSGFMAKLPDNPLLTVTGVQYDTNKVTLSVTPGPVVADDQGSSTTETKVVNEFGGTPGSKTDVPLPLTINVPAGEDHSVTTPRTGTNALTGNRDKTGTGKLVLNSDVELKQGVWNVSEGTLQVGGDGHPQVRFTGDIDVKNGTTLEGFGSISGTVHVREGGTLAPGGSAGLMSITNPVLDAKSNFDIDIRPVTKQNEFGFINDTLKVSDTGSIAKGTNLVLKVELPEDNAWKNDHEYKVLDATASGADIVKDNLFSIKDDEVKEKLNFLTREPLIYDKRNKTVTLRLSLKPQFDNRITRFVENGKGNLNQLSIAESLRTTSHFEGLYRTLLSFNTAAGGSLEVGIPAALSNLAPEIYASASDSLLQNSHYVRDAVLQNYRADNQVWISTWGHGGRSQGDSQYTSSSVSNQGWGVALGSDLLMAQNFSAGLMAGFERTTVNGNDASSGKARINAAHLGAYLHANLNQVNLSGGLIYSLLDQKAERRIDIAGIGMQGKLSNDNSGHQVQLFAELNRDFHMATSSTLTPYVNLAHVWQSMGAGTEKALGTAEPAALRLDKDHKGVTFTGLGLRGTLTLPTAAPASLYFAAGWQHAFGDTNSGISSYFNGATEQAVTHGTGLAKDSALINTGLNIQMGKSSTLNVSYQGEFGSGHTDNAGKIQWQMRF